jgi:DNA-binding LytR/AlgR family response regulator
MLRIAIVDDNQQFINLLTDYLHQYGNEKNIEFGIATYHDGDEIVQNYKACYDIIFMDIEMRFVDGMTASEEIRKVDSEVIIIFITVTAQYAIRGYTVNAMDYLLKPIQYFAFSQRLDRACERLLNKKTKHIIIKSEGTTKRLDIKTILFIEVSDHYIVFHLKSGRLSVTGTLKDIERRIDSSSFYRCGKAHLINLGFVDELVGDEVIIAGETLQVSRSRKKGLLDALNNYINEGGD